MNYSSDENVKQLIYSFFNVKASHCTVASCSNRNLLSNTLLKMFLESVYNFIYYKNNLMAKLLKFLL